MRSLVGRYGGLALIVLAGISLRLLFVWFHAHEPLYGDQISYYKQATLFAEEGDLQEGGRIRPPLYRMFLAGLLRVGGGSIPFVRYVQAVTCAVSMVLCYLLAREFLGRRGSLIAVALFALCPDSISAPSLLLTEVLLTPLLLLAFLCARRFLDDPDSRLLALLTGVTWALASLTRSVTSFYFALILLFLILFKSRFSPRRSAPVAIMLLAFCLTIAPWTIRNARTSGAFIPIAEDGAFNIWWRGYQTVHPEITQREFRLHVWSSVRDPGERGRVAIREGIRGITSNPRRFIEGFLARSERLWITDAMSLYAVRGVDLHSSPADRFTQVLVYLERPFNLALVSLATVGIVWSLRRRSILLLSGFVLYQGAAYAALASVSRYRLPVIPLLAVLAVFAGQAMLETMSRPAKNRMQSVRSRRPT